MCVVVRYIVDCQSAAAMAFVVIIRFLTQSKSSSDSQVRHSVVSICHRSITV